MNVKNTTVYAWLTTMLLTVTGIATVDMFMDLTGHLSFLHAAIEIGIIVMSMIPAIYMLRRWRIATLKARNAKQDLEDYLQGLGSIIEQEFEQWELTESEKRTALYILKGLSHKEIAAKCHRSEGTVRQHAVAVYRKSGLASRAEFAAYFLVRILPPMNNDDEKEEPAAIQAVVG